MHLPKSCTSVTATTSVTHAMCTRNTRRTSVTKGYEVYKVSQAHLGDGDVAALSEVGQLRSALELSLREASQVAAVTLLGLLLVDQPVEHRATHSDALRLQRGVWGVRGVRWCEECRV